MLSSSKQFKGPECPIVAHRGECCHFVISVGFVEYAAVVKPFLPCPEFFLILDTEVDQVTVLPVAVFEHVLGDRVTCLDCLLAAAQILPDQDIKPGVLLHAGTPSPRR